MEEKLSYGSVCSGIEAATMAWHPLGWSPAFFSEIEKFPSAVLAHHYPSVPNHGDMTRYEDWPDHAIDLLVGGTPCQSFSVAGLRKGLADPRGNLMLTYLAIARRYQPRWLVWENVPGVLSSNGGRDFAAFIRGLEECGYHAAWRVLDAQYVRVDGFARAVPQRRRRVFVVGYLGDWRRAAAVLLEPEGMLGDSPPRRQSGEGIAPTISARPTGGGGLGTDFDCDGGLIVDDAARCVTAGYAQRMDWETENFVGTRSVAATLTRGAESSGKGGYAGRRQEDDINLVAFDTTQITSAANYSRPQPGDPCHPLAAGAHAPAVAFQSSQSGVRLDDVHATLDSNNGSRRHNGVMSGWAVRRLTPTECERLQGFPDDFTDIQPNDKPTPDGPRYKALGNSMAVNCMRWIGRRIQHVEAISSELERAAA
jgi:DNA (cytosine-5)-methyltransferase 1